MEEGREFDKDLAQSVITSHTCVAPRLVVTAYEKNKEEVKERMKAYGVFLNIHPSCTHKRVTLHKMPCSYYKMHYKKKKVKQGVYTFHIDCNKLVEAIQRAAEWSREWNAPFKVCQGCLKNW